MSQTLVVLAAGASSRFGHSVGADVAKSVYREAPGQPTLLGRLLDQTHEWFDRVIIVAGYRIAEIQQELAARAGRLPAIVANARHADLGSSYSLYLGMQAALADPQCQRVVCIEADLAVDTATLRDVCQRNSSVITATTQPIHASHSVIYYRGLSGAYRYAFDSGHQALCIPEPFTELGNSGQVWAFADRGALASVLGATDPSSLDMDASVGLVTDYLAHVTPDVVRWRCWHNCNTVTDLRAALACRTPGCAGL